MTGAEERAYAQARVFISYSRADSAFADRLAVELTASERFDVLIDRTGIGHGDRWRERLGEMIAQCDTVVFILSPDSLVSETCVWELAEAGRRSKRIIPVLWRAVDFSQAPAGLSALNAVPFTDIEAVGGVRKLIAALDADLEWLKAMTRLGEQAADWERAGRSAERVLRGTALEAARDLVARRPAAAPEPTALQRAYLAASEEEQARLVSAEQKRIAELEAARDAAESARERETKAARQVAARTRAGLAASLVLLAVSLGAGGFAFFQREEARGQRAQAVAAAERADAEAGRARAAAAEATVQRDAALLTQSRFLARTAQESLARGDAANALAFARTGLPRDLAQPDRPFAIEAAQAIFDAWGALREQTVLRHSDWPLSPIELPDGGLAVAAADGTLRFWAADGALKAEITAHEAAPAAPGRTFWVMKGLLALADGRLVSWSDDKTIKFWSQEGALLETRAAGEEAPRLQQFDDGRIAEWGDGEILIRAPDWRPLFSLKPDLGGVARLRLLPSGRFFALGPTIRRAQIMEPDGAAGPVLDYGEARIGEHVAELSDGRIVTDTSEKSLRYWTPDGAAQREIEDVLSVWFQGFFALPDDRLIAFGQDSYDSDDPWLTKVFGPDGALLRSFKIGGSPTDALRLSDGRIVLGAKSNAPSIWTDGFARGPVLRTGEAYSGGFSELEDGRWLTRNLDGTVRIWSAKGQLQTTFLGHEGGIAEARRLADGRFMTRSARKGDHTVRLWGETQQPRVDFAFEEMGTRAVPLRGGRMLLFVGDAAHVIDAAGTRAAKLGHGETAVDDAIELADGRVLTIAYHRPEDAPASGPGLRLWTADGALIRALDTPTGGALSAVALAGGGFLSLDADRALRRRDREGRSVATLLAEEGPILAVRPLDDGRFAVTTDRGVAVLTADGEPAFAKALAREPRYAARALADGGVAVATRDEVVILEADGRERLRVTAPTPFLAFATLSGGRIAISGVDRKLRIWDAGGALVETRDDAAYFGLRQLSDGRLLIDRGDETEILGADGRRAGRVPRRLAGGVALPDGWIAGRFDDTGYLISADGRREIALRGAEGDIDRLYRLDDGRLLGVGLRGARIWPGSIGQAVAWADEVIARLDPLSLAERCAHYLETDAAACAAAEE